MKDLQILTSKICAVGTVRRTLFHWHLSHAVVSGKCVKSHVCMHTQSHTANKWERNNKCQRVDNRKKEGGLKAGSEGGGEYS